MGSGLLFMGREFLHHRPCCLGDGKHALVLLLHFVPLDFPTVSCDLRLDPSVPTAGGGLRYDCVPHSTSSSGGGGGGGGEATSGVTSSSHSNSGNGGGGSGGGGGGGDDGESDCDARADAWAGPLHELDAAAVQRTRSPSLASEGAADNGAAHDAKAHEDIARDGTAHVGDRYLLYSPCVAAHTEDGYCLGQLNNQLHLLHHALAVSRALRRTLVLPPLLWMPNQSSPSQLWFPASHFLDLCAIRRHHPTIELHTLARRLARRGETLSHVLTPPYIVPDGDPAYSGHFFEQSGLRIAHPRLISPHAEAVQATSGRGAEVPFEPREGLGYWRATAIHIGHQQRELRRQVARGGAGEGSSAIQTLSQHVSSLLEWRHLAREHTELGGEPLLTSAEVEAGVIDAVAFDYAPSFNFHLDCFTFDAELRDSHRAIPFAPTLVDLARTAARQLFGEARFLAAHVRRDGYDRYCSGAGLQGQVFKGRRFGVHVTPEMCYPSMGEVAASLVLLLRRHGIGKVLLATNEVDQSQLRQLQAAVPYERWRPPASVPPEAVPVVEMLLCARAAAFVGTLPSTFTTTILVQRDLRGASRNSTSFFGALDFFERAGGDDVA